MTPTLRRDVEVPLPLKKAEELVAALKEAMDATRPEMD